MTPSQSAALRRLWLNIHLWLGIGLTVLLVPISISGGLLVFHDELDALLTPHRYAVSGPAVAQPPSVYLARAAEAVAGQSGDQRATAVRYPEHEGYPVRVISRAHERVEPGTRPRTLTVFLDPPTGKVLDVVDFRSTLFGFLHVFHENLTIPQHSGRQIVGWAGVAMLILSLSGIYLWWPRHNAFRRALRFRRSPSFNFNLHNMLGFWIAVPLAVVSLTGMYLAFPQTAREMMSSIAAMNPQAPRATGEIARQTGLTPDRALDVAREAAAGATVRGIFLPTMARGEPAGPGGMQAGERGPQRNAERGAERRGERGGVSPWRVQFAASEHSMVNILVDDRSGSTTIAPAPQSGDRAASWIRWIHEGSHSGPVWMTIVFLTGVFPTIFAITGILMWLRKRANRRAIRDARPQIGSLHPAE